MFRPSRQLHPLLELKSGLRNPCRNEEQTAAYHHSTSKYLCMEVITSISLNECTCEWRTSQASDTDDGEYHPNPDAHLLQVRGQAGECSRKKALYASGEVPIHNDKSYLPTESIHCRPGVYQQTGEEGCRDQKVERPPKSVSQKCRYYAAWDSNAVQDE